MLIENGISPYLALCIYLKHTLGTHVNCVRCSHFKKEREFERNKLFRLQFDCSFYLIVPRIGTLPQQLQLGTTNMFPIVVPYLGTKGCALRNRNES